MKTFLTFCCSALLFSGCAYDDGDLRDSIDRMEDRLKKLEEKVTAANGEIASLRTLVEAVGARTTVESVVQTGDRITIRFSDGTSIEVLGGTAAYDIPMIGVRESDEVWYWTLTVDGKTDWLTDGRGNRMAAQGTVPELGVDAEGFWTIDAGGGPKRITDSAGNPIPAGEGKIGSIFASVVQDEERVTFTLFDGTEISLPRTSALNITFGGASTQYFYFDESRTFDWSVSREADLTVSKPDGWRVRIDGGKITITAPATGNAYAETEGDISVIAVGKSTKILKIKVFSESFRAPTVVGFEDVPANYLAGPTPVGENLYSSYPGEQFISYTDPASGLIFGLPDDWGLGHEFWYGGAAISRWNDRTVADWTNQCSVYYSDATTGKGGNNGSETFSVACVSTMMGPNQVYIEFDGGAEYVIDHLYICNSAYAALSMQNGDAYAKKFTYADKDWLVLTFQGFDAAGNKVGVPVDYYLADFRTAEAPGIARGWNRVDLASMGKIHKLGFWMASSDGNGAMMNTPAYFCMDDVAVRR